MELKEHFASSLNFPAYRRTTNLKDILAPSKFKENQQFNTNLEGNGCFKCTKKCDLCKNNFTKSNSFWSCGTGLKYKNKQQRNCSFTVLYLATCSKCSLQYVGSTITFKIRFRNHKSFMKTKKKTDTAKNITSLAKVITGL